MKTKFTSLLLVLISAFMFTSCGDSKEKLAEDSVTLTEKIADAAEKGDKEKVKELEEEAKEFEKRAEALGLKDMKAADFKTFYTEEQQERLKKAMMKRLKAEAGDIKGMVDQLK